MQFTINLNTRAYEVYNCGQSFESNVKELKNEAEIKKKKISG